MVLHAAGLRPVILLLGGTSETAGLVEALLREGLEVLVSTATDASLLIPEDARRRCGRLDAGGIAALCRHERVLAIVDAGHPYAKELHEACRKASALAGLPLLRFQRAASDLPADAFIAADHEEAAWSAFAVGGPVLLTTGSRNLAPYVAEARRTGLPLLARVLDHPESLAACALARLESGEILAGRGPYCLEENRALIRRHGARALVTKDSGEAGGVEAKLKAARLENCHIVIVSRPSENEEAFQEPHRLAQAAAALCRR